MAGRNQHKDKNATQTISNKKRKIDRQTCNNNNNNNNNNVNNNIKWRRLYNEELNDLYS